MAWTSIEKPGRYWVEEIKLLKEEEKLSLDQVLEEIGFMVADRIMLEEGEIWAIDLGNGRVEYAGVYNTHRAYVAMVFNGVEWENKG